MNDFKRAVVPIGIHCSNRKEFIDKLVRGGLLINISDQCGLKSFLDELDNKGVRHEVFYDKNNIKILKVYQ